MSVNELKANLPDSSNLNYFVDDLVNVAKVFIGLTDNQNFKIELELISNQMCRLFHVDRLHQRLLCTYRGPGSEWLDESNVDRRGLGKFDNSKVVKDSSKTKSAKPFDILILRGSLYELDFEGVVHRSPSVKGQTIPRVLFKIDELPN